MKQHSCVIDLKTQSTSSSKDVAMTQITIEKVMVVRKTLTVEQSKTIKDLIVRWICNDILPVSIIEDDELRALIQECIRLDMDILCIICTKYIFLGSIYGNIEVNDILRSRSTVSNHIQVVADSCRARIKTFLEEPYKSECLSISSDFWCGKYKQICYLDVTAVVVDKDYKYYTFDLFCKQFQEYEKTGENILIVILYFTNKIILIQSIYLGPREGDENIWNWRFISHSYSLR